MNWKTMATLVSKRYLANTFLSDSQFPFPTSALAFYRPSGKQTEEGVKIVGIDPISQLSAAPHCRTKAEELIVCESSLRK